MPLFTVISHLEMPTGKAPIVSGAIRMQIDADSEEQAREKAQQFIMTRMRPVVDSCTLKLAHIDEEQINKMFEQFKDIFK